MYVHYLLVLLSNLLLLLLLLFGIVVVHLGLCEAGDEVVKDAKELIGLGGRRVLAEHPANPVEPAAGGRMVKRKTSDKQVLSQPGFHVSEEVLELCKPDTGHGHELSHDGEVAVPWGYCLPSIELHLRSKKHIPLYFVFEHILWKSDENPHQHFCH